MPELPEVETTRRGLAPHLTGATLSEIHVRQARLRHPPDATALSTLCGQTVRALERRAKYLLMHFDTRTLIVHLGMSGSLRLLPEGEPLRPHDHVVLGFGPQQLVYHDPRRFGGFVLAHTESLPDHALFRHLGPEPLSDALTGDYLYRLSRGRRQGVKPFIMDQRIVVGVGNIYATEALFSSGIRPDRPAGRISRTRYDCLAQAIKAILSAAIEQGGTTLRDFVNGHGKPGYFAQTLQVYGREGTPCPACQRPLRLLRLGGRSSVFCASCQR
ncbi:MAG: bifunctional DNA-formamidopyrimidine glycosylase/DNA-(apurinic or apyrimidinic site) lyase [Gammaproteobacteria bacterium]|nr:MAG: bifunctional DNA-formamidopyrimidine glycosylase/DNA-(apurinic or apyrimidinic site) lyase [Gammaproteobacteria bacterium]